MFSAGGGDQGVTFAHSLANKVSCRERMHRVCWVRGILWFVVQGVFVFE